jgi:hypothetical protein
MEFSAPDMYLGLSLTTMRGADREMQLGSWLANLRVADYMKNEILSLLKK